MQTFTPRNLTPALTLTEARRACRELVKAGKLRRVRGGYRLEKV